MRRKMKNDKGFTLAELLIVVAIIAVLVAVSIPIFTNQLEKSREATDVANFRAAKAAFVVAYLDGVINSNNGVKKYYYHADTGIVSSAPVSTPYGEGTKNNPYNTFHTDPMPFYPTTYEASADYTSAFISAEYNASSMKESLLFGWEGVVAGEKGLLPPGEEINLSLVKKSDIHVDPTTETNTTYP